MNENDLKVSRADSAFAKLVDLLHEVGGVTLLQRVSQVLENEAEVHEDMAEGIESDENDARVAGILEVSRKVGELADDLALAYEGGSGCPTVGPT